MNHNNQPISKYGRNDSGCLSKLAMDYYKKYGQNRERDIKQYFILSSQISSSDEHVDQPPEYVVPSVFIERPRILDYRSSDSENPQNKERKKWSRPIGTYSIHSLHTEPNETLSEMAKGTSPTSSISSHKRLEWDSGADVGYYNNYFPEKCKTGDSELPILTSMERRILQQRIIGIDSEDNQYAKLLHTDDGFANTAMTTKTKNTKPCAESTPVPAARQHFYRECDAEITPIPFPRQNFLNNQLDVKDHSMCSHPSKLTEVTYEEENVPVEYNVIGSNKNMGRVSPIEKQLPVAVSDNSERIPLSPIPPSQFIPLNPIEENKPYSVECNQRKAIIEDHIQLSAAFDQTSPKPGHEYETESYNQYQMQSSGTYSKSNSFEYLPGNAYEQIITSDAEKSASCSYRASSIEPQCNLRKIKACYRLNSTSTSSEIPEVSLKSSNNYSGDTQFCTNLSNDIAKTIDALKNALSDEHGTPKQRKKLVKQIVKKIVNADYEDGGNVNDHSYQHNRLSSNVPWVPATFKNTYQKNYSSSYSRTSSHKSAKAHCNQEVEFDMHSAISPAFNTCLNYHNSYRFRNDNSPKCYPQQLPMRPDNTTDDRRSSSEESVIERIYQKLGLRENEHGLLVKVCNSPDITTNQAETIALHENVNNESIFAEAIADSASTSDMTYKDCLMGGSDKLSTNIYENSSSKNKSKFILKNYVNDPGLLCRRTSEKDTIRKGESSQACELTESKKHSDGINWKMNRTFSEKLFEMRAQYLHDQRISKNINRAVPLTVLQDDGDVVGDSANILSSDLNENICVFGEEDRMNKLIWVNSKIEQLSQLKTLLEIGPNVNPIANTKTRVQTVYSIQKTPHVQQHETNSTSLSGQVNAVTNGTDVGPILKEDFAHNVNILVENPEETSNATFAQSFAVQSTFGGHIDVNNQNINLPNTGLSPIIEQIEKCKCYETLLQNLGPLPSFTPDVKIIDNNLPKLDKFCVQNKENVTILEAVSEEKLALKPLDSKNSSESSSYVSIPSVDGDVKEAPIRRLSITAETNRSNDIILSERSTTVGPLKLKKTSLKSTFTQTSKHSSLAHSLSTYSDILSSPGCKCVVDVAIQTSGDYTESKCRSRAMVEGKKNCYVDTTNCTNSLDSQSYDKQNNKRIAKENQVYTENCYPYKNDESKNNAPVEICESIPNNGRSSRKNSPSEEEIVLPKCQQCGKRKKNYNSSLRHRIQVKINNCERCKKLRDVRGEIPELTNKLNSSLCRCSEYYLSSPSDISRGCECSASEKWEKERVNLMRNTTRCPGRCHHRNCCLSPPPPPVAYFLTFKSREDIRLEEEAPKKSSLEEITVFVPPSNKIPSRKHSPKCGDAQEYIPNSFAKNHRGTLQEYLLRNRPDFIQAADCRRQWLSEAALIRNVRMVRKRKLLNLANDSKMIQKNLSGFLRDYKIPKSPHKKAIFTTQVMREMTERHCKSLPEVQQKKYRKTLQMEARTNRLMMQIFNKKLQNKVHKGQVSLSYSVSVISML